MVKFSYGNAWEQFPIEQGEVWGLANGSKVAVHDIFNPLPEWMKADLVFVDLPYNTGQITSYYTKAGLYPPSPFCFDIEKMISVVFDKLHFMQAKTVYIEIGKQNADLVRFHIKGIFPYAQEWKVKYYGKHDAFIFRGGYDSEIDYDFTGMDEEKCIDIIPSLESCQVIGDLCMGRGLVGISAFKHGKVFVGTELNKRRLACMLAAISKKGGAIVRY